ncbi:P-loop containing nucleoside triphosphate hydrolase protein [Zopfochytrium polystomum]|nr:P-loop containing nucleoside triphosphate hydrolase protein [Zopfochytrium polystomum]
MTTVKFESKDYPGTFAFDKIFDWSTTQQQVFDYAAGAVIEDVMRGYNGTIFAYGQTGSGKTHTMMGDMESEEVKGLTPRLVESIFDTIFKAPPNLEFTVKVSYMEIYMEKIKDLLNPSQDNLPIHEEKNRGVYVKGLLEVFVGSVDEVYDAMRRGQDARVVASTNMNAESSRSHSIFVIQVSLKNLLDGSSRTGKLYLVDLAGSEKVGKTGATGQTLEEAKKINKSLSALGMVINALTDGKSSHIPYRDSKLTRILQESLGGNSRTTLIINCSPSSFNEAETLSTLRFGMRAKTIKNKAKVNAELSPAELKNLLKKVKQDVSTLQTYVSALETEVKTWRSGGTVAQADWASPPAGLPAPDGAPAPAASAIPASVTQERASTPAIPLTEDEREEFLKRESELSDQYAESQAALKAEKARAEAAAEELAFLKTRDEEVTKENKQMAEDFVKLKLELEKLSSENKEGVIVVDSLKEANSELTKEIEALKAQIVELQATKAAAPAAADPSEEKERKKMEKMAQMMAEFDPTTLMSDKEKQIRLNLSQLVHQDAANSKPPSNPDEIAAQHIELIEAKTLLAGQDRAIEDLTTKLRVAQEESAIAKKRREEAEAKVSTLESEYQELLERTLREEEQTGGVELTSTIQEIKNKLEAQYTARKGAQEKEIETLKASVTRQETEVSGLQLAKSAAASAGTADAAPRSDELEKIRQKMGQQLGEFDAMKKKLMRDLQNRCEKVVELEISLEETREQYNTVLRNSNSRAQQQKMAFLERNLEQLTHVQRQLVEQNASIKKELAVAERKLVARSERVSNLEALLADTQTKLELQNQKFEAQLATMREKLQEARAANPQPTTSWLYSSRIAKPLRGGGAAAGMSGEDESDFAEAASKRSSWYVSLLKKN